MLATTAAVSTLAGKPRLLGRCASPATTSTATSTSCHVLSDADSLSPLFLAADDDDDERFDLAALSPIPDFADDSDEDDTDGGDALLSALDCRCYELADAFEATYSARPRLRGQLANETVAERTARRRSKMPHVQARRLDRRLNNKAAYPARKLKVPSLNYVTYWYERCPPRDPEAALIDAIGFAREPYVPPVAPPAPLPRYAFTARHARSGTDAEMAQLLEQLQFRDLTPEDYEFLLRLDESVKPKTAASLAGNLLPRCASTSDASLVCAICMDLVERGQELKRLPACGHEFHGTCITRWLSEFGRSCPVDGLPVDEPAAPTQKDEEMHMHALVVA